jgi:hypothetical protein
LTRTLRISNTGGADLEFYLVEVSQPPRNDLEWLSVDPEFGSVEPGGVQHIDVGFDATEVGLGTYLGRLDVESNDPLSPTVSVPVTLTVSDSCDPVSGTSFTWQPPTPTAGQVVTFTADASGSPPITFAWDLGDGAMANGYVINHIYESPILARVEMTATNPCGQETVLDIVRVHPAGNMHVRLINLRYREPQPGRYLLQAIVRIVDRTNTPVEGATVAVEWMPPAGPPRPQARSTNPAGAARFALGTTQAGDFEICVTGATKDYWAYNPSQNVETCDTISVP